ncbi:HK97 family phage prohead protease [Roseibaca sp. Y0-43]|uniref:HK97 family phage prohead protease n=1 Tax=Roseibaca sp. Y0-43 TaxID=2816854 RepID=UPI001D0C3C66|nr:HK97 family phage prohead protease [Roseibaca sp. Y0-43]MCC1481456.1 HK97 family phage prohead protease [Roseibaca sp. Y0-43]
MLEYKFIRPEPGLRVVEGHEIAGYASVFGQRDRGGDTVVAGAYAGSLARLAAAGEKVRMLWQHDPAQPIGIWDEVREDAVGLYVKGRLLPDVARAREAQALLAAGAVDGLSIGYRTLRAEKLPGGGRRLIELDLWEVSLVTFPMQSTARIDRKSDDLDDLSLLTAKLRAARAALAAL